MTDGESSFSPDQNTSAIRRPWRELLSQKRIRPGGRLITVWGKLYQQDDNVYVQTFAKFYRSPTQGEKATTSTFGIRIQEKMFEGKIIGEEFAFPPEQLQISLMNDIAENFKVYISIRYSELEFQ